MYPSAGSGFSRPCSSGDGWCLFPCLFIPPPPRAFIPIRMCQVPLGRRVSVGRKEGPAVWVEGAGRESWEAQGVTEVRRGEGRLLHRAGCGKGRVGVGRYSRSVTGRDPAVGDRVRGGEVGRQGIPSRAG